MAGEDLGLTPMAAAQQKLARDAKKGVYARGESKGERMIHMHDKGDQEQKRAMEPGGMHGRKGDSLSQIKGVVGRPLRQGKIAGTF